MIYKVEKHYIDYQIGKRYIWSSIVGNSNKDQSGLLSKIESDSHGTYGIFITKRNEEWKIYLPSNGIEEYKKNGKRSCSLSQK